MCSICINYDKSEAAWLGNKNTHNYKTPKICKWVDLNEGFLKILGIYFSYDTQIVKQLNFDRVLQNLNSVLNLWKLRSLTIYGRTEIVKSLAMPKKMYVCEMLVPSENFLKQVKSKIFTFVWKNKPPRVAYDVLVKTKLQGGLKFPDIFNKVKTQNIMYVKRLLDKEESPWKIIPKFYLSNIGGIRSNFNVSSIPKEIPNFYKECLKPWASFVYI